MCELTLESLWDSAGDAVEVDVAEGGDRQTEPRLVALAGQRVELTEAVLGRKLLGSLKLGPSR